MSATIEIIAGTAYLATECAKCKGTGRAFDITNVDCADGSTDASGSVSCPPRIYRAMWAIEIEAYAEAERRERAAGEEIGEIPDWMM